MANPILTHTSKSNDRKNLADQFANRLMVSSDQFLTRSSGICLLVEPKMPISATID